MALKTFKPITPSLRQLVIVDRSELYKGKPLKTLTEGLSKTGGRNNTGRTTVRFRGGGHKQTYRIIDFKRRKLDMPGKVERIEYDPNRTSFIALVRYHGRGGRLYHRAAEARRGRLGGVRQPMRREARQRHAARQHPGRHDRAQYRDEDRQGRRHRPVGRATTPRSSVATPAMSRFV